MSRVSVGLARAIRDAATVNAASPPLKSMAPRPKMSPPRTRPANGSTVHRSGSTPTTSSWPASSSGLAVGFAARRRAMKCALPGVGVGMISVSNPSGRSRACSSSAICCSLPGGFDVLRWISCLSRSTTSPSGPSSCAFATPGANAQTHTSTAPATAMSLPMPTRLPAPE